MCDLRKNFIVGFTSRPWYSTKIRPSVLTREAYGVMGVGANGLHRERIDQMFAVLLCESKASISVCILCIYALYTRHARPWSKSEAEKAPVIPVSAVLRYNIDVVCEYLVRNIPIPVRDFSSVPRLIVIRSFDVNKPGEAVEDLKGESGF